MILEARRFADLDARTLYGILQLRFDVFVLEQRCLYRELDGRDMEIDAWHFWIVDDDEIVATLRLLGEAQGSRIGRVATRPRVRGTGMAVRLMRAALEDARRPVQLDAQVGMEPWYEQFGFVVSGQSYDDGGIAHVPMRLH